MTNDSHTVLVFPGFGAGDLSTFPIRRYLRARGFIPATWKLGANRGDVAALIPRVTKRAEEVSRQSQRERISIVGWSLGGVLAREVARDRPDLVRSVVTMGSPIRGPRYTAARSFYENMLRQDLEEIERLIEERGQIPIHTPVSALYSRRDRVVQWESCIDRWHAHVKHIEVDSSHLGLGFDPRILRIVANEVQAAEAFADHQIHHRGHFLHTAKPEAGRILSGLRHSRRGSP